MMIIWPFIPCTSLNECVAVYKENYIFVFLKLLIKYAGCNIQQVEKFGFFCLHDITFLEKRSFGPLIEKFNQWHWPASQILGNL